MVVVKGLHKAFDQNLQVLNNISFTVDKGESLSIVGPSGCGKTTLLYVLSGLIAPTSGSVSVNGREAGRFARDIAFILQDFGLLPWKTVWENVCLGMKIRGVDRETQAVKAEKALAELGILEQRNRFPASLSGGEKQRIAIGRALTLDPELLLMDEPFSSLDTLTRENLQGLLLKVWMRKGLTMILVTHSIEEAVFLGRSIVVLGSRPGSIKEIVANPNAGTPEYRDRDAFYETCKRVRKLLES